MRQNEYTDVVIKHRGLTKAIAEGCKEGARYRVELSPRGRIKVAEKIGLCRETVTAAQAEAILVQQGVSRIEVREEADLPYVATACRRRDRYSIKINLYGDVSVGENLGRCRRFISIRDICENLRSNGDRRIEFTQRQGRRIRAEACRGRDRVELVIGRYGRIRRDLKVGRCPPPIDEDGLRRLMAKTGFSKIRLVSTNQDEFATIACRKNERMSVRFSRYGEVIDQERVGTCVSPRIEDLLETLERRGVNRLTVHIEGCRGRNRLRVTYNAYGERLRRERIGRCLAR